MAVPVRLLRPSSRVAAPALCGAGAAAAAAVAAAARRSPAYAAAWRPARRAAARGCRPLGHGSGAGPACAGACAVACARPLWRAGLRPPRRAAASTSASASSSAGAAAASNPEASAASPASAALPADSAASPAAGRRTCGELETDSEEQAAPSSRASSSRVPNPCAVYDKVDPACWDHVVPFDARFLEALDLNKVSEPSDFQSAVSNVFDQIDLNKDGRIGRDELETMMRQRIYSSCPPKVWALTPDQLMEKLGATGQQVTRDEFASAVERIADTLDSRVWPLATSQLFSALMFAIGQPLMPIMVKELGISMAQFGGMVAVMPLIRVALAFPATYIANHHGRKPLTVEGQLIAALGFAGSAYIAAPWQLVVSRLVIGTGTSFAGVGQQNMLGDIATGRTRSRVFAPGAMRASAAFAFGPALGGWLAATCGVQTSYLIVGAGMAVVSIGNRFILQETLRAPPPSKSAAGAASESAMQALLRHGRAWWRTGRDLAKDPLLRAVTLANAGFNFTSISSKFVLLPMLALDTWGLGASGLGLAIGAMSLAQFAAARPAAYVADVYGRNLALIPGLGLTAASMGVAATGSATPVALSLVCGGWALGTSLVGSVPSALTLDAAARCQLGQKETARALALSRIMGDLGMAAGCLASGVLLTGLGAPAAFGTQASVLSAVTALTAAALRGTRPGPPAPPRAPRAPRERPRPTPRAAVGASDN